jgi:peptidoglycan/LPS O-acetylase OafA/YrhL
MLLAAAMLASLEQASSLRAFWVRRITRLYPPYWLSVALYAALGLLMQRGESVDALLAAPVPVVLANLSMFQLLFDQPHLNYGYWTLLFELLFYMLAAGLFAAGLLRHTALVATVMCALAILVEVVLPLAFGATKPVLGLVSFLATMFLGTIVYRLHTRELGSRQAAPVLALGVLMLVSTAFSLLAGEHGMWGFLDYLSGRVLALIVFLAAFALRARRVPRVLLFLGQISYSVYLLHMAVIVSVSTDNAALNIALWAVATVVLATCSYRLVEQPAMQLGRRLTRTRPAPTISRSYDLSERVHAEVLNAPLR